MLVCPELERHTCQCKFYNRDYYRMLIQKGKDEIEKILEEIHSPKQIRKHRTEASKKEYASKIKDIPLLT